MPNKLGKPCPQPKKEEKNGCLLNFAGMALSGSTVAGKGITEPLSDTSVGATSRSMSWASNPYRWCYQTETTGPKLPQILPEWPSSFSSFGAHLGRLGTLTIGQGDGNHKARAFLVDIGGQCCCLVVNLPAFFYAKACQSHLLNAVLPRELWRHLLYGWKVILHHLLCRKRERSRFQEILCPSVRKVKTNKLSWSWFQPQSGSWRLGFTLIWRPKQSSLLCAVNQLLESKGKSSKIEKNWLDLGHAIPHHNDHWVVWCLQIWALCHGPPPSCGQAIFLAKASHTSNKIFQPAGFRNDRRTSAWWSGTAKVWHSLRRSTPYRSLYCLHMILLCIYVYMLIRWVCLMLRVYHK